MKKFSTYITEAAVSTAGKQAEKLGLSHAGYGRWMNKQGEVTHISKQGKLIPVATQQQVQPDGGEQPAAAEPTVVGPEPQGEVSKGPISITFGRFNPPTVGHEKLIQQVAKIAGDGDYRIYPSRSVDTTRNPLDPETKVHYMRLAYPDHAHAIHNDDKVKTIFDVLQGLHDEGYSDVNIVVGADRVKEFSALTKKYNGKLYNFDNITIKSAGDRDPDADDITGMSASKLRAAVAMNDYQTFMSGIPSSMKDTHKKELYNHIRGSMKVEEIEDFADASVHLHEIAPKLDPKTLREEYYNNRIFKIGSIVENVNTGVVGKIVSRGVNYVIYIDINEHLFRGWLKDLIETNDIHGFDFTPLGEFGTNKLVGKLAALTPGQFIQKINNRKKN
jgi:hypothetical protein